MDTPGPTYMGEIPPVRVWGVRAGAGANSFYAELFEAYHQPVEEDQ